MEFVTLFKDFGFPALVVGVLLWIVTTKLERIIVVIQQNHEIMLEMRLKLDALYDKINENTRPRGSRGG